MSSATTFFRSRWIEAPAHVTELDPHVLPAGFRAAGVAAGLKPDGLDVGVLVSDAPDTVSAARFTSNARVGAPVIVSRQAELGRLRAVVANSGGSNVGDGQRGLDTAVAMQAAAAAELEQELPGVHFSFVAHLLPIDQGILASCYAHPNAPITAQEAHELAMETYRDEPFVDVIADPPRTRDVRDTNRATVQVTVVNDRVLAFCAIDNLWKGAAGQAVQDLNLMLGLPETEGLE